MKPVKWESSSQDDLRDFPRVARSRAGYQLDQVQHGEEPDDWKPMSTVGHGVYELRVKDDASNNFRVIYIAKYEEAVYVLHCFHKTTQQTAQSDIDLAKSRFRDLDRKRST